MLEQIEIQFILFFNLQMIYFYNKTTFNVSQFIRTSPGDRENEVVEEAWSQTDSQLYSSGLLKLIHENPSNRNSRKHESDLMV